MSQTRFPRAVGFTRREALRTVAMAVGATALPGAFGVLSSAARAASPSPSAPPSAPPMVSNSLGGKFSWISGAGGNIAVLGGDDGVLAIDSGLPNLAAATAAEIAKSGRVTMLVNTHRHLDHAGGNDVLAQGGADIIAHENCRERLSTDQFIEALDMKLPAASATARPRVTFTGEQLCISMARTSVLCPCRRPIPMAISSCASRKPISSTAAIFSSMADIHSSITRSASRKKP